MVTEWDVWSAWADSAAARAADINDIYDSWLALFEQLAMQHVGSKRRLPRPRRKPWWHHSLKPLIRARDRARKRLRANPTAARRQVWQEQSRLVKLRVYEAKQRHLGQLAERLAQCPANAPRQFWSAMCT